jgi:hypothetical protein
MKKKKGYSRLIKEKHDHKLIKGRGLDIGRGEGRLGMEKIKWKGPCSKDRKKKIEDQALGERIENTRHA